MKADPTPASDPPKDVFAKTHYRHGSEDLVAYETPPRPGARRPAIVWITGGFTPTLVIEGEHGGNAEEFPVLQKHASRVVKFVAITGADHFSVLAPATEALARAILADTGPKVSIALDIAAIARGVEESD